MKKKPTIPMIIKITFAIISTLCLFISFMIRENEIVLMWGILILNLFYLIHSRTEHNIKFLLYHLFLFILYMIECVYFFIWYFVTLERNLYYENIFYISIFFTHICFTYFSRLSIFKQRIFYIHFNCSLYFSTR